MVVGGGGGRGVIICSFLYNYNIFIIIGNGTNNYRIILFQLEQFSCVTIASSVETFVIYSPLNIIRLLIVLLIV